MRAAAGMAAGMVVVAAGLAGCAVTPEPIGLEAQAALAAGDRAALFADQEPVRGAISLEEAVARALKYNLDQRLTLMEQAVQTRQLDLNRWDLLPKLAASAGYTARSNEAASSSESVLTRTQSLEPSVSQDRRRSTADLSLSWNILDFGASYYAARQQADRALIAGERRRKTVHAIIQQVRAAYWQAATAEEMAGTIAPVLAEARKALADAREIERQRLMPPLDALRYQKTLLEIVRQLEALEADRAVAKAQLAALMNLPPGGAYSLAPPGAEMRELPKVTVAPEEMERLALVHRPELREEAYQARVSAAEVRKAMLKMLPGLTFTAGGNYDTNSYLVHQTWAEAGARLSWNLLSLLSGPAAVEAAEAQQELGRARRLALSMAVLAQVNIAQIQYQRATVQYAEAAELATIEQKIYGLTTQQTANDAQSTLERIRSAASAIVAVLQRDKALADAHGAIASIYVSMGLDPLPEEVKSHDLATVAAAVGQVLRDWQAGRITAVVPAAAPTAVPAAVPAATTPVATTPVATTPVADTPAATPAPNAPAPNTPAPNTPVAVADPVSRFLMALLEGGTPAPSGDDTH